MSWICVGYVLGMSWICVVRATVVLAGSQYLSNRGEMRQHLPTDNNCLTHLAGGQYLIFYERKLP